MNVQSNSKTTNYDFNRILISRFISGVGDWGGLIAISNISYNSTHSVKDLSIIYAAKICSILFSSVIQSKLFTKFKPGLKTGKLLASLEAISAVSLLFILFINQLGTYQLAFLYFISAICSSLFLSLTNTLITEMFPLQYKEHFRLVLFSKRSAFLLGPVLMGAIIGFFGNKFGVLCDSLSFLISGAALASIATPLSHIIKHDLNNGSEISPSQITGNSNLFLFTIASMIVIVVGLAGGAVNAIELPYIVTKLKLGSSFFGISLTLGGMGSLLGILLDKLIPNKYSTSQIISASVFILLISFIPWYFTSKVFFGFGLVLFGIGITVFSNQTLFYFIDCYNESVVVRNLFQNKPKLFLFYHQIDSISMIVGAIVSGLIADKFTTNESVNLIIISLIISLISNLFFKKINNPQEAI